MKSFKNNPTVLHCLLRLRRDWVAFVVFVGIFIMAKLPMVNLSEIISDNDISKIKERLFNLSFPEPNTGCHIWCAATYNNGYGFIRINNKSLSAHRVSYFVSKGEIGDGLVVDHLCNNIFCINPLHLEAKTHKENILRSSSPSALNALKTHCDKGHLYGENKNNVRVNKKGGRDCLICLKEKKRRYYNKNLNSILEKKAEYYKNNRERIRATQTLYNQKEKLRV